jgi:hypothetical protein
MRRFLPQPGCAVNSNESPPRRISDHETSGSAGSEGVSGRPTPVRFPLDRAHLRFDSVEILRLGNPVTNVLIAFRAMDTLLEDFELVRPNVLQAM